MSDRPTFQSRNRESSNFRQDTYETIVAKTTDVSIS